MKQSLLSWKFFHLFQNNNKFLSKGILVIICLFCFQIFSSALLAQTYSFTPAGAIGQNGPTQPQVNLAYVGTSLEGLVTVNTQGIQEWTVPVTGTYSINSFGAQGGRTQGTAESYRGAGARIYGEFNLTAGQVIKVVVGQEGLANVDGNYANGGGFGGGGSFIWINGDSQPLIAAGGGGGGSIINIFPAGPPNSLSFCEGKDGTTGIDGTASHSDVPNFGTAGGNATEGSFPGKGWNSMFGSNNFTGQSGGFYNGVGGFGGGGGGADFAPHAGGGGGGYSAGGSGFYNSDSGSGNNDGRNGGGGGGSVNNGSNQITAPGVNTGQGIVVITFITNTAPIAVCQDYTAQLDSNGSVTITGADVDGGSSDPDGDTLSLTVNPNTFDCSHLGTPQTVTLTVDDGNGGTDTCTATVTVVDTIAPTITCPADVTLECGEPTDPLAEIMLYGTHYSGTLVQIDPTTGAGTVIGNAGNSTYGAAWNATTDITYVLNNQLNTIDLTTAAITPIGSTGVNLTALTFNADYTLLYSIDLSTKILYSINTITGAATIVGNTGIPSTYPLALATDTAGTIWLGTLYGDLYTLNSTTGAATLQYSNVYGDGMTSMAVHPTNGKLYMVTLYNDLLVEVDLTNGNATLIGGPVGASDVRGLTFVGSGGLSMATATDNCGGNPMITYSDSEVAGSCPQERIITRTWTATDASGNSAVCEQTITITDTIAPVANCPSDININNDAGVCGAVVNYTVGGTDNCGAVSVTQTAGIASGELFPVGDTLNTFDITDECGNTSTCSFTVSVNDTEAPTAICRDILVELDASGNATIVAADVDGGSTDNCGIVSMSLSNSTFNCADVTVIPTNPTGCPVDVNYNDTPTNANSGPNGQTFVAQNTGLLEKIDVVTFNPLQIRIREFVSTDLATAFTGTILATSNSVDGSGNFPGLTTFTFADPPILFGGSNYIFEVVGGGTAYHHIPGGYAYGTAVSGTNPSATRDIPFITYICPLNATSTILTVTDAAGNTASCTANIIVVDTIAPTITCPGDIIQSNDAGICGAVVNFVVSGSDNCSGGASGENLEVLYVDNYDLNATELPNELSSDGHNVTIVLNEVSNGWSTLNGDLSAYDLIVWDSRWGYQAPAATLNNIEAWVEAGGNILVTGYDVVFSTQIHAFLGGSSGSDFGGNNVLTVLGPGNSLTTGLYDIVGTSIFGVSDWDSLNGPYTAETVDIVGAGRWTLRTIPNGGQIAWLTGFYYEDGKWNTPGSGYYEALKNFAYNTAGNSITQTAGLPSGSEFPVGTTTNTFVITDASGNTATCSFDVTIEDDEAPTISCPADIIQSNDSGICGAVVTYTVTTDDNCTGETLVQTAGLASGSEFPVGTTTNTFVVTDASGTTATCSFDVTINDTEAPIANCAGPFTLQLDADGNASITVADIDNGSTDNCGIASMTIDMDTFDCSNVGDNIVTLTVTDVNDNVSTCTTIVTVEDSVAPVANCAAPFTLQLDADGNASITVADIDNGSTDACGIASMTIDMDTFDCSNVGDNTVTLTVTDVNGNVSTCTTVVTVEDNVAPVANCAAPFTIQLDADGNASITVADIDNGSTDACGIASTTIDVDTFDCSNVGDNTVTLTVTDVNGNVSTCTTVVTVEDNLAPIIACPADITANTDPGDCFSTVSFPMAIALDNCGVASVLQTAGLPSGSEFPVGVNTIEFTATDVNGNTSVCSFTITVTDNEMPVAVCQDITLQLDPSGNATITAADVDGGSSDNCGVATTTIDMSTFDCSNVGPNNVTLTVTDVNGNVSTCIAVVTVEDVTAPVVACQDITVQLDANGTVTILGTDIDNGSTDACGIANYELDMDTFDCSNVGDNIVILTVTDVNGNTATCTATVTVEDVTAPVLVCQDFILELGADGTATLLPGDVIASNDDACGIFTTAVDITEFDCSDIGTPVIVQVFTQDNNGNLATCNATVTVVDLLAPVITCPADQTVDPGVGNLFYELPDYFATGEATAIDNCTDPVTITTQNPAPGTMLADGVYTITLTAEDEYGNISTCSFELTVESILGMNDNPLTQGAVSLYPNPAKDVITFGNPQLMELELGFIYDLTGRLVQTINLDGMGANKTINVEHLSAATYIVMIKGKNGQITKRFIKE